MKSTHKPVLIISCSDKKKQAAQSAFDLYEGSIFTQLRSLMTDPTDIFDIYILSALHGLVPASDHLNHYNLEMVNRKDKAATKAYVEQHGATMMKLLRKIANKNRDLYVCMSNNYLSAFDAVTHNGESITKHFRTHYILRKQRGSGDIRGAISRIVSLEVNRTQLTPIWFRSGIANLTESAYISGGCDFGGSLFHTNTKRGTALLSVLLDGTHTQKLFLDNGLISFQRKGQAIDPHWVFDEYTKIIKSVTPTQRKNISIVVPDDPFSNDGAVEIMRTHKKTIKYLCRHCDVIVPIHRSTNIREHATAMMSEIDFADVRLGIPCLSKADQDFLLPLEDVDALMTLTKPKKPGTQGTPMFSRIHYFAMSDVTSQAKLLPRLKLAALHGLTGNALSLDCCRTTAIFGKTKKGLRAGSKVSAELDNQHKKDQVTETKEFKQHGFYEEYRTTDNKPMDTSAEDFDAHKEALAQVDQKPWLKVQPEPLVSQRFFDLIDEDTMDQFWDLYNFIMDKEMPAMTMSNDFSDIEESMAMAWQVTSSFAVEVAIIKGMKEFEWEMFAKYVGNLESLSKFNLRYGAIQEIFKQTTTRPLQMPLFA